MSSDSVFNAERKCRFVQEAKAASALKHPNIVTIYDIDSADGCGFIAMEFIEGRTLRTLDRKRSQEPLHRGELRAADRGCV